MEIAIDQNTTSAAEDLIGTFDTETRWYVAAQYNGKTALLYGPCTKTDAEAMKGIVLRATDTAVPGAWFWTWGVAEWKGDEHTRPLGKLTRQINAAIT